MQLRLMIFETDADASCYPDYADNVSVCPGRSSEVVWIKAGVFLHFWEGIVGTGKSHVPVSSGEMVMI